MHSYVCLFIKFSPVHEKRRPIWLMVIDDGSSIPIFTYRVAFSSFHLPILNTVQRGSISCHISTVSKTTLITRRRGQYTVLVIGAPEQSTHIQLVLTRSAMVVGLGENRILSQPPNKIDKTIPHSFHHHRHTSK